MSFNGADLFTGEPAYTDSEKELRDRFVQEFLRDYNSYAACVRLGFMDEMALEQAKLLIEEPYVKRKIADAEASRSKAFLPTESEKDHIPENFVPHDEVMDKQRIVSALFREAFYKGPGASHASRVSALGKLADIYKLAKDADVDPDAINNVMVVPAMGTVDDWEQVAANQQEELKRTVKD